jgi:hypothetical protein
MKLDADLVEQRIDAAEKIATDTACPRVRAAASLEAEVLLQVFDVLDDPIPPDAISPANWRDSA